MSSDTIVAQATPSGCGGISVVRVSGVGVRGIAKEVLGCVPKIRYAAFCDFLSKEKDIIDKGVVIYFCAPHSFTGEDVLELHCHGGLVVVDLLLRRIVELGARIAKPGEFTQRAFLNNKIDLAQAEAVADLISAATSQAAKNAYRSLSGDFSKHVECIISSLKEARVCIETAIDFSEEENYESDIIKRLNLKISDILLNITSLKVAAKQGELLQNGIAVVLVGKTNSGKSSIFNCLTQSEKAIVSDVAGTTRDVLHTNMQINGLQINLFDTAGLNDNPDVIEQEGIRRALEKTKTADHVLLVVDCFAEPALCPQELHDRFKGFFCEDRTRFTVLFNKIDLVNKDTKIIKIDNIDCVYLSAKNKQGIDLLKEHLRNVAGFCDTENVFCARRRHIEALKQAEGYIKNTQEKHLMSFGGFEFIAEDLRQAQVCLEGIIGKTTTDDLLDSIFSEFCVGK